ncbi:hypothetical protein ACFL2V_16685 [Pseudomonadota bacterium]
MKHATTTFSSSSLASTILLSALLLTGCGAGGDDSPSAADSTLSSIISAAANGKGGWKTNDPDATRPPKSRKDKNTDEPVVDEPVVVVDEPVVDEPVVEAVAILSWIAPASRADESPLTISDIDSYKIYMGDSADSMTMVAEVLDPYVMNYELIDLSPGTHFFAITAVDTNGLESGYSKVMSKNI